MPRSEPGAGCGFFFGGDDEMAVGVGWLVGWLLGCLVAWLLGCLVAWLLGWLVGWLVAWAWLK